MQNTEVFAKFERHAVLAGDHAYKAASFYHPRLTAVAMKDMSDQQSSEDVLQQLLNEIDITARIQRSQAKQLTHAPVIDAVVLPEDDEKEA